jgi:hypothetical protein
VDVKGSKDPKRWKNPIDASKVLHNVPIELVRDLSDTPALKTRLLEDVRFASAHIVNPPGHRRPNPFPLTDGQWSAIMDCTGS